jgi:ATP-dependent helicase/DNAse subunit B
VEFPELDFDNRERGILVHQTLEHFWKETRSLNSLLKLASQNRLKTTIENAAQKALKQNDSRFIKQPHFYQLEKERIADLTLQWLDLEMDRADFEVVDQEKETFLTISGIRLRLRIDRIDKTNDEKIFLIDYKTGEIKTKDWFNGRIKEPQLPLYAYQQSPSAILFGQVKKGSHKLI